MTDRQLERGEAGSAIAKLSGRVLLAEDNDSLQRLLTLNLRKLGLQVDLAGNGEIAVAMALENHYDLVLMDMQMPVLSGLDAVSRLRKQGYMQPIVALTANVSNEDRRQCLEAGCNEYLSKPITSERLFTCLGKLLDQQEGTETIQPLHSNLSSEGPEFVDIIVQFIVKLPDLINNIETNYRADDRVKLREVVHNLKGMGGGFGFPELTEHAAEIERLMQQDDMDAVAQLIGNLRILSQRIEAGLPFLISKIERNVG
jgi:CheY-like chemotaxis protein/HPt (histidine-containing phosphotransfer) domain-containing protein